MTRRLGAAAVLLALALACGDDAAPTTTGTPAARPTPSSAAPGGVRLVQVGAFDQPLQLVAPKDDPRLFVVQKAGKVVVVDGGIVLAQPFLDISDEVSTAGEQGLLSMAFAPDYATSGRAYVNYTDRDGDTHVDELRVSGADPNRLDPATRRELLRIEQPYANHNGGLVMFDPTGMLVVGMGDGGSGNDPQNRAQNLDSLLGKLLRIDPAKPAAGKPYGIPADNPFVGRAGARPEIYAYGLRNPWRFSYGPDGTLYLGDVGQGELEEIDIVAPAALPGANFGWRVYEGDQRRKNEQIDESRLVRPALVLDHANDRCAVTGGFVHTGSVSALKDRYVYGDFCSGEVFARAADGTVQRLPFDVKDLASFGVDAAGELYAVSLSGPLYKLSAG